MKTGDSLSPSLFVHAGAAPMTRTATAIRIFVFMTCPLSSPKDPWGQEDEQLVVLFGSRLVAEEAPQNRDLPQSGDHVVLILIVDLEDPSDDGGASIPHEHLTAVLANRQRNVVAESEVQRDCRLTFLNDDVQQDRALGRDLRRHFEPQGRVDVDDRRGVVDGRLNRDLHAGLDEGLRVGQCGELGRGDDLEQALVFGGRERDVQIEGVQDVPEPDVPDDRPLLEADPEAAVEVVREDEVRFVSMRDVGGSVEAPVDAEAAAERLRGLDDPRLDHDLRCRRVQVVDQLQYGRQESRDLADDEGVRPRVDHDVAATRHDALQNRNDLGGARVRQLLDDRAGGLRGLTRLREPRPVGLLDPEPLGRRDPHDVVFEHVTEVVLLQDQVEGLVPGNVLELDGDGALDVRIDDAVQPGELR